MFCGPCRDPMTPPLFETASQPYSKTRERLVERNPKTLGKLSGALSAKILLRYSTSQWRVLAKCPYTRSEQKHRVSIRNSGDGKSMPDCPWNRLASLRLPVITQSINSKCQLTSPLKSEIDGTVEKSEPKIDRARRVRLDS